MNEETLGDILEELKAFTNVTKAIFADQKGEKPQYPYITFKIIAEPDDPSVGIYNYETVESENPNFDSDIEVQKIETSEPSFSINVFAKTAEEAKSVAMKTKDFFKFHGCEWLKRKNIVTVSTSTIENRDALMIIDYERRYGFDVILRYTRELKKKIETIETYSFSRIE
ncbi:hypothetical protein Amet_4356 [Alkaliphilus metalliredigens QYMF]|uniref:Phage neck terminator protein gp12-like domain-containing protein n=1 Tax=Alkaliphilus metalliredigens (strain QYMF) TaxID=293826 RepID=A6TKD5_ALKMQ|nr:hypothetical protein [Alkaliphilus metalliredigens]ABR46653.1 hypothetical protein Amet_0425 [Alkaliphilus metalliredigens QYMF]ABR48125.1 hypothetical protein Amet_1962 [Alkaliphilus metalliredigens QYMF]ABR50430.1 hypothetical protein Amet_4356 [Alkaliphilus metalliredigens QYMF]